MKPMLAEHAPAKIQFPVYGSLKIDGIRCVIKGSKALSRSLKVIPNKFFQEYMGKSVLNGLDMEVTVGPANAKNVMQATTSGLMSFEGVPDFTCWVFDFWTPSEIPYSVRLSIMEQGFAKGALTDYPRIKLLEQTLITDEIALRVYEQNAIEQGYEGVIIRKPTGVYKYGRSTAKEGLLLKVKRFTDGEAVVIGAEELLHNANEATTDDLGYTKRSSHADGMIPMDTLGALQVRDLKTGVEFSIGTGYTAHLRAELWAMFKSGTLVGKIAKYKHFAVCGVKEKPRIPVFIGFRDLLDIGEPA